MFNVLVVSLCKPVIQKLKILDGGKLEYYKSMGGTTKKGGKNFEISVGISKRGLKTIFDSNFVGSGGGVLEETMIK